MDLSQNLVLLLALTFIYSLVLPYLKKIRFSSMSIIIGLIFGIVGIIGMYEPIQVAKGINIDGRVVITAVSGAMGGFLPGLITGMMVGFIRMWIGGAGAIPGTGAIFAGALTGALFFRYLRKGYNIYSIKQLAVLGVLLVIEGILATLTIQIPLDVRLKVIKIVLVPLFILYPAGTITLGLLLSAETKRRGKERELHDLFEYANDAIFVTDLDSTRFLQVNENAVRLLGYSKEELLKLSISDIAATSKESITDFVQRLKNRESFAIETVHIKKDGTNIPVEVDNRQVEFEGNKVVQSFVRDITERKQAENQIKISLKEKETLLQEIHHRVKNNMQIIASLLKLQSSKQDDPVLQSILIENIGRIYSMSAIHENLYRSDRLSEIDLKSYISQLSQMLLQTYSIQSSRISYHIEVPDIKLNIDKANPLGLVLNELISNSLKYAFPKDRTGIIGIKLTLQEDNNLLLIVTDDGVGIPDEVNWEKPATLGLQLVRDLVEKQLNGSIKKESQNGTKFTIELSLNMVYSDEQG